MTTALTPATNRFTEMLASRRWLLADGATGSNLFDAGLGAGYAPEDIACLHNLVAAAGPDVVLVAKGNCGVPQYVGGAIVYHGTPELMAVYGRMALDTGARIIGGCCGTSPAHRRAMREALDAHVGGPAPELEQIVGALGEVSTGARAQWGGEQDRMAGAAPGANLRRGRGRRSGAA